MTKFALVKLHITSFLKSNLCKTLCVNVLYYALSVFKKHMRIILNFRVEEENTKKIRQTLKVHIL